MIAHRQPTTKAIKIPSHTVLPIYFLKLIFESMFKQGLSYSLFILINILFQILLYFFYIINIAKFIL